MCGSKIGLTALLAGLNLAAGAQGATLPVDSPAVHFSPGNWSGDAGRGGSQYRVSWNNGAYCLWYWTSTGNNPTATLNISNQTPGSAVSYYMDGRFTDNFPVPASGGISISGLSGSGDHVLAVYLRNSAQAGRWDLSNACKITGLTLDDANAPRSAPPARPWVLIIGDSITEGIQAGYNGDDSLMDYSFLVGQGLRQRGFEYGVSACGYSGWIRPGDATGDVPGYYDVHAGQHDPAASRWDKIDAHTSLRDARGHLSGQGGLGQEPAAILINYGVNEALSHSDTADLQASVTGALSALRRAAPDAVICVLIPPGLPNTAIYADGPAYIAVLRAGVAAYHAAHPGDANMVVLDLGPQVANALASPTYGGGVHPNAAGHAYLAPQVLAALLPHLGMK